MKIYKEQNVYDAALERIRWCFDEFEDVIVSYSGGKDSTVIFEMALQVAKEKNRLPLKVMWLDQELEWKSTVEQVKSVMYRPEVEPMWYQIPMLILNASSGVKGNTWLHCWYPNEEWAREQDPISIKVNRFGTNRFHDLFGAISKVEFAGKKVCYLGGVRAEESPGRYLSLTATPKYKWITWGKKNDPKEEHYTMYPIYDWSYIDVWKAIYEHKWRYSSHYDSLYQLGVEVKNMRVSNIHHETAVESLFVMQEIEPDTYEAAVKRMGGLDTAGKMGREDYFINELPFMFESWKEYRDYLLENLIEEEETKKRLRGFFTQLEPYEKYLGEAIYQTEIQSIVTNDWDGTKLKNYTARPCMIKYNRLVKRDRALKKKQEEEAKNNNKKEQ